MNKPFFTGVSTALVTPFLNNRINFPMLQILLARQISAGVESVVLAGTTGESATLSDQEKLELFRKGKEYADGSLQIIAGTGSNDTRHAVELSIQAQEAGVDGLLVVSPYYNKATPDGIISHYAAIARSVSIPIIIYNVPTRTGLDIPVSVYEELSKIPNIAGVKEASTDIGKHLQIRARCPDSFSLWAGNDHMTVPVIALGGVGVISVLSNLYPEQMNIMTYAALNGDIKIAREMQQSMLPWTDFLGCEVNPIPAKAAMAKLGFDCGPGRLPLTPLSNANQKVLDKLTK